MMRISGVLATAVLSLVLATAANAQEENRVLLQRFPVPQDATACQRLVPVSAVAKGVTQVKALLALPESKQSTVTLGQVLAESHLTPVPEHALALGLQGGGVYFIPALAAEPGSFRFVVAAEQEEKATAFLLTFSADAALHPKSVTLSTLDGKERYVLDLTTGESYHQGALAPRSITSTLACLWSTLVNSMSAGVFICSMGEIVFGCVASGLTECPGVVAGVLGGVACVSGIDNRSNYRACFGGSDTTPPSITSLSPAEGSTVTAPFPIACQASDSSGIQSISLLFDSNTIATCSGSSCNGNMNLTGIDTTVRHVVTCVAKDGANLSAGQSHGVWVRSGGGVPAAPSGLSASALSASSIRFSWHDNSNNETSFRVYRWNGSAWQQIITVGTNVTSYTDSGLRSATTYYYTVCATNSTGSACAGDFTSATTR